MVEHISSEWLVMVSTFGRQRADAGHRRVSGRCREALVAVAFIRTGDDFGEGLCKRSVFVQHESSRLPNCAWN